MEKEELLSKINESLGSTQLSEKTIGAFVDDLYEDVKENESVSDEFIARKVNYLKAVNGQLHADVSAQVNEYKKNNPYRKPKEEPKGAANDEPEWFKSYRESQENRLKAIEESARAESEASKKREAIESVKRTLKSKFSADGIEVNGYFLNQAINSIDVAPQKDADGKEMAVNIDELVKEAEKAYYRHLKEAGIEKPSPKFGNSGGGSGDQTDWIKKKFADKGRREGWKK